MYNYTHYIPVPIKICEGYHCNNTCLKNGYGGYYKFCTVCEQKLKRPKCKNCSQKSRNNSKYCSDTCQENYTNKNKKINGYNNPFGAKLSTQKNNEPKRLKVRQTLVVPTKVWHPSYGWVIVNKRFPL